MKYEMDNLFQSINDITWVTKMKLFMEQYH